MEARRVTVNQPSKLQPYHAWHRVHGIAVPENDPGFWRLYFLSGDTISMRIEGLALAEGWL